MFLQYITANMNQQYQSLTISNLHICYYQYYSSRRVSPPCMQCLYAVLGYKHFLTPINYFRQLYTSYGGHILLTAAIYYFRRLHITFNGYILLLALPDSDFVRIQDFLAISRIHGLKAMLEFIINFLALIQFCLFCSSMVSSINFNILFWKYCFIRNTQMLKM